MVIRQRYTALIRRIYENSLRRAGFRRRGVNCRYFLSQNIVHLVNFQKSVYSDLNEIRFTVNLGVYRKGIRSMLFPETLEPSEPSISDCIIQERLGVLLPDGHDKWWVLSGSDDTQSDDLIVEEVIAALSGYGLPFLARFQGDESILQFVLERLSPKYPLLETTRAAVLACVLQRRDTAARLLRIALEKAGETGWDEEVLRIARRCSIYL